MFNQKIKLSILLLLICLSVYSPIILNSKLVDIDYAIVIEPLKNIHSFLEYSEALGQNKIMDVQYVRDLSLLLDLYVERLIGYQVHGFFNVLFWLGSTILLLFLLIELKISLGASCLAAMLFLTHPLAAWVLSWPSARKHILSLFFIAAASYLSVLLKKGKLKFPLSIAFFYLLSILSQPIHLLWIIPWTIYFFYEIKARKFLILFYSLVVIFSFFSLMNYLYYDQVYPYVTFIPKLSGSTNFMIGNFLIALSRSLSQVFIPINFAFDYEARSVFTLFGLPALSLTLVCLIGNLSTKHLVILLFFILSPLALVSYKPTNIFISDTYIIGSLFFVSVVTGLYLHKISSCKRRFLLSIPVLLGFVFINIKEQLLATDIRSYYQTSYQREPTCKNILSFASFELQNKRYNSFVEAGKKGIVKKCMFVGEEPAAYNIRLFYYLIYLDTSLTHQEKLNKILEIKSRTPDLEVVRHILEVYLGYFKINRDLIQLSMIDKDLVQEGFIRGDFSEKKKAELINFLKYNFGF